MSQDEFIPDAIALTHNEEFVASGGVLAAGSTNVEEVGPWDYKTQTLTVRFKSGSIYEYYDVPLDVVVRFVESDSPGRFVWSHLRDVYSYALVGSAAPRPKPNVIRGYHD